MQSTPDTQAINNALSLDDKFTQDHGRIYISGIQALVRLPMLQKQRDARAGLNTAGYVSGYRGSPLGGVDLALWQAKEHLQKNDIVFQPGLNEDLAATAVWGTQQTNLYETATRDGVFGMWYGKGPGVDRSMDVLKHANAAGTSPHGGVLVLAGDDHAAKSSSVAHQSEHVLLAAGIPVLYPSNVQEYLDFGLHGWAMSRYSGLWVAMKCVTDVVESSASVEVNPERVDIKIPTDFQMPADGLNIRWPDTPLAQEQRLYDYKWYAALEYIRLNKLNRIEIDAPQARFGIMTAGKAYLDVRQALADLGLSDEVCEKIGIRLFKVGCVWPLDARDAREFATGLDEILVVEEKRQILEYALKEELYNWREDVRPSVYGKFDERDHAGGEWSQPRGQWLLPARYELSPAIIAKAIASRLLRMDLPEDIVAKINARLDVIRAKEQEAKVPRITVERKPWYCSGCPHNTSTKVPEGSRAMAGIGCHYMVMWMDRNTETFTQMGGEGVTWLGQMHFTRDKHVFVNLGDGTYFHSGLLAIRASIAAKANITYKILYNDAVAMTGGQPVDGVLTVPQIAQQVLAEGAAKLIIVSDEPEKYAERMGIPDSVTIHHRDEFDGLQKQMREVEGVSIIIYDQTCATEKRRRRKRGTYPDPAKRVFINTDVCEACGDCSVQSNCLSIEPKPTSHGNKRQINQSTCNKDFSCVKGFCPSFVTLNGAQLRKPKVSEQKFDVATLPEPNLPKLDHAYGIVITGVGGTGVITVGALLGMAAHLEQKGVTVLDMTGLAQKGGSVFSHVQIAASPDKIHATRIATGEADLLLGCDAIVAGSVEALSKLQKGVSHAVVNRAPIPSAEFITNADWTFPSGSVERDLQAALGDACEFFDSNVLAVKLLGDSIYANPLLLGYAWQKGWIPLTRASILQAMTLNAVQVEKNKQAFEYGRLAAHDLHGLMQQLQLPTEAPKAPTLDDIMAEETAFLTAYQSGRYAQRYREVVQQIRANEQRAGVDTTLPLSMAVARNLAKLMAYKDEYEVGRLYSRPEFLNSLRQQFAGEPGVDYQVQYHLAPPALGKRDADGHLIKQDFQNKWITPLFKALAVLKPLRGTPFDPFGYTEERKAERRWIEDYIADMQKISAALSPRTLPLALEWAALPQQIRGYGHVKEQNMQAAQKKREHFLKQAL